MRRASSARPQLKHWSTSGRVKWAVPFTMSRSVNLRSDLWAAALPMGSAGQPWLAAGGVPSLALARGGDEVGWEDRLRGVVDSVSGVTRLWGGPGWSGKPVRQMSLTQSAAGCGSECASWRSRARAQCLSASGLACGLRGGAVRGQCGRGAAEACGACLPSVGPGGCVRAAPAATWRGRWRQQGACRRAGLGARGRAQRAQVCQGPIEADEQSQRARRSSLRSRPVQRSGGGVAVPSAIAPRDVPARARHPRLIEPRGQRLREALLAAAGALAPLNAGQ